MKRAIVFAASALVAIAVAGDSGCSGFGSLRSTERLVVEVTSGVKGDPSSAQTRIPLSFDTPQPYTVKVTALKQDGSVDTSFNGFVRLTARPGTVSSVSGPTADGRNVKLTNGTVDGVGLQLLAAYGDTRIWAEDLGYVPADPARNPPPQCSDGIDNNGNGTIDFPADAGCAYANDDTEDGGTYTAGGGQPLYYYVPRIADIRGVRQGGTSTSFPNEQVTADTGYRGPHEFEFSVVVTRVSSDGFYVTDLDEDRFGGVGWGSVFAYNFSAPPNMRQCDRLRGFGGTTSDFFGFTEVNYPTWELEEWDPATRPCLIPEPHLLAPTCPDPSVDCAPISAANNLPMIRLEASLVRVATENGVQIHIGRHFGPNIPAAPAYTPTDDATNCDLTHSGKINRNDPNQLACANACAADPECSEYSNYLSQNAFNLVLSNVDASGNNPTSTVAILANGSTAAQFDPILLKGQPLRAFTGTLRFFSGGSQFTIEARCQDDIVTDLGASPVPSDTACVHARTILDNSAGSN